MKQRIITGLIFGILSLALILFNDTTRVLYIYLAVILSFYEYLKIIKKGQILNLIIGFTLVILPYFAVRHFPEYFHYLSLLCFVISICFLFSLRSASVANVHTKLWPVFSLFIFGFSGALFAHLIELYDINYLLIITILIWVADSGAYFVGKSIGKRKFAPLVSPKKTWEGFIGGGMITALVAYIINSTYLKEFGFQSVLILALTVWFFGAFGDLIQSHVKRSFGTKDSGTLLPGHGGFYDRFDGFIYVLAGTCFIIFYLNN